MPGRAIGVALTLLLGMAWEARTAPSNAGIALGELHHTAWGPRDGLIGRGYALAQTPDGFLWIGTRDGLYRFDGIRFEKYQPVRGELPVAPVRSLLATAGNTLWIGFTDSRISRLSQGEVTNFGSSHGIPLGVVRFLVPDGFGGFFSSAVGGIIHFDGKTFEKVRQNWSLPLRAADCALLDSSGTLWITSEGHTFYLLRGEHAFRDTGLRTSRVTAMIEDRERIGLVAEYGDDKLFWVPRPATQPVALPYRSYSHYAMIDRDGTAWIGGEQGGLHRARDSGSLALAFQSGFRCGVESLRAPDGLSANNIAAVLQDQEGNVWSLTDSGLDRFRAARAVDVPIPAGYYNLSLGVGPDREIWGAPWETAKGVPIQWVRLRDGKTGNRTFQRMGLLAPAENGALYFCTHDRDLTLHGKPDGSLWRWDQTGFTMIPRPPGLETFRILSIAVDSGQRVWVQVSAGGEWIYHPSGRWERRDQPVLGEIHAGFFVSPEVPDAVYLLYPSALLVSENDHVRPLLKRVPPGIRLQEMAVANGLVFVGTDHGIFTVRNQELQPLPLAVEGPGYSVLQMLASVRSGLWIATSRHLIHLTPAHLAQLRAGSDAASLHPEVFDPRTELPALQNQQPGSAVEGPDGALWFPSVSRVVRIDPRRLAGDSSPPLATISHLRLGQQLLDPLQPFTVPPGSPEVRFEYTAPSLAEAASVRFRYRLDGLREDWLEAGERREVSFWGLPPGDYRFSVVASRNDGVWNAEGASVSFRVLPRFYQTLWFKLLAAAAAVLLLSAAFLLRMRRVAEAHRLRTEARESERQHIARELHDEFFPGLYGLFLSVGNVAKTLQGSPEPQRRLESLLENADEVMKQGRELVLQLRNEPPVDTDFIDVLVDFGRKQEGVHGIAFRHSIRGTRQAAPPAVQKQLVAIGREALWNAFRHSKALDIALDIEFHGPRMIMRIKDDGIGIPAGLVQSGREGHLGLHSMRERAAAVGAAFTIQPNSPAGTVVVISYERA